MVLGADRIRKDLQSIVEKIDTVKEDLTKETAEHTDPITKINARRLTESLSDIQASVETARATAEALRNNEGMKEVMSKISKTKLRILDEFESRIDHWKFGDFERALEQAMGSRYGNYQTAKMTIIEADREGRWPKTVERYVRSNRKALGNLPVELQSIGSRFDLSTDPKSSN